MSASLPKNEPKRLKVLWQYDVLDTVPEEVFDNLTELAAHICEAPIAVISLVDEDRTWYKSKIGLPVSESSRDISLCSHAILQHDLFIVPDATRDARFARNPLVTAGPKIRFYAGMPLVTPDGYALGTLCVLDTVPRELRPDQKQALRNLAHHIMTQLELRRHALELARTRQEGAKMKSDLQTARAEVARLRCELSDRKAGRRPAQRKAADKTPPRGRSRKVARRR